MRRLPIGQRVHAALITDGMDAAAQVAREAGQLGLFERVTNVALEDPSPSFLHSALCAMSLPVRRPADEKAAILRYDGQYTLAITPKAVLRPHGDEQQLQVLGVPYGALPRLILIHIMTEAVRTKSRHVRLGDSLTDWLRKMKFKTVSFGPRGTATLVREQLDRLLACEWMIRWDAPERAGRQDFGIKEIRLTTEYAGSNLLGGGFTREIVLSEGFYDSLVDHAVPLNENAISQLRDSATALDLYTWLAYRLPRISNGRPAVLSWQQLAVHFGNDGHNIRKFRQTIREAWEKMVSGVYPEARVEFDTKAVYLYPSPSPLQRTSVPTALRLIHSTWTDDKGTPPAPPGSESIQPAPGVRPEDALLTALRRLVGPADAQAWLEGAALESRDSDICIVVATRFKADWIRAKFEAQLIAACREVGMKTIPPVAVKAT